MSLKKQNPGVQAGASHHVRHIHQVAEAAYRTASASANAVMPVWPALIDGVRMVGTLILGERS